MKHPKLQTTLTALVLLLATGIIRLQAQTGPLRFKHDAGNLAKVAEDFSKQFKVQLAYADDELAAVKVPAASYEAPAIGQLLNKVLAAGGFKATANGNNWIIKKAAGPQRPAGAMLLQLNIREGNAPVPNATVMIKQDGLNKTIDVSDEKGNFSKKLPFLGGTVEISAIGYLTARKSFNAAEQQSFTIALLKDAQEMQGVVVTALGIKREERALGYSTTVVKGEQLTEAMSGNWTDALSGKVAGLNLVRSNAGPTGSNKIVLRGENNLDGNNEALIVVDGVVINQGSGRRTGVDGEVPYGTGSDNMPADYGTGLNDINGDDIESVTILKGPGAAALYGQRGANGAIIITTKSGNPKRKGVGVSFTSNASLEQVNRWPDLQYEYGQGLGGAAYYSYGTSPDGASTSSTSSSYGPRFDKNLLFYQYDPVTQTQGKVKTPWVAYPNQLQKFFTTGQSYTNTISVDGGSDKTTARFSYTNVGNKWIIPNTGYKRNTIAMSVNSRVNDRLQISSKINYTNKSSDNLPGSGYGNQSLMYWYIFWQPNASLDWLRNYWANGQEGKVIKYPFSSFPENPFAVAYEFINETNRNGITGNIQGTYNFTKELSLQIRTSIDMAYEQRAQKRPYDAGTKLPKGSYRTQNIFSMEASSDFLLRYAKKINSDFEFSVTGGGSTLRNTYNKDETRADSLTFPGIYTMSNAAGPLVTMPYKSKYVLNSFYGLASVAYRNFLYADFTARQDWASPLATPTRTANAGFFYPSANLSFIASEVLHLPSTIDFAKLRFSASSVGSGGTAAYLTAYNYSSAGSLYNGGLENPALLANPDLRPLRTVTLEAGVNMRMFNNRLGFDLAVYNGKTKDQHLRRIIDRASGFAQVLINAGEVRNRGIELAVNGTPVVTKGGFKWTTNIVFSANSNKIQKLLDSSVVLRVGPVGGGQIVAKVGGSMGDLYGIGYQRSPDGQVVYDAQTGVALLTQDVKYLGNVLPKWKLGFTNEFAYRQFRLHLLFDAQYGGVSHSLMHYKLAEQGKTTNTLPGRYNGLIGNGVVMGTDGKYRKNDVIATDIDAYYRSHYGVDNAEGSTFRTDFIKFREARLEYSLNAKLTRKLGLQRAAFGVYGRNLFIWSPWPMFDPEFGTLTGNDILQGFEIGQFPSTRTIGCNLVIGL